MGTLAARQGKSSRAVAGKGIPTVMKGAWNPEKTSSADGEGFHLVP